VEALDQEGNLLPFLDDIIQVSVTGPAKIIGPEQLALKGGAVGFWLEAGKQCGDAIVTISSRRLGTQTLTVVVE